MHWPEALFPWKCYFLHHSCPHNAVFVKFIQQINEMRVSPDELSIKNGITIPLLLVKSKNKVFSGSSSLTRDMY